jgi:lipopolysaccharide transport system ATP-binding protein
VGEAETVIRVENLSKRYVIDHAAERGQSTLRDALASGARGLARRFLGRRTAGGPTREEFWAVRDVSFEVKRGEVIGLIGRNGAGKSTLLKLLSRITEPTNGRIEIDGRVASLLEVGTGFHPELTGRENAYLNGSILGMSRAEIRSKFDEIVAFAEIEKFLDTPVKRYSSGMYMRLAFAVAAHLEPEILVVDEVLAVGDGEFQRKCFAKMDEIRRTGRTVLVVSHNLGAIQTLCTRAIQLEQGRVVGQGEVAAEVARYLARLTTAAGQLPADRTDREGAGRMRVVGLTFQNVRGEPIESAVCGDELRLAVRCTAEPEVGAGEVALSCWSADGVKLFHVDTAQRGHDGGRGTEREYVCRFPRLPLAPGRYHWNVMVTAAGRVEDHLYSAATLEVLPGDFYRTGRTPQAAHGAVLVDHEWV